MIGITSVIIIHNGHLQTFGIRIVTKAQPRGRNWMYWKKTKKLLYVIKFYYPVITRIRNLTSVCLLYFVSNIISNYSFVLILLSFSHPSLFSISEYSTSFPLMFCILWRIHERLYDLLQKKKIPCANYIQ